MGDMFRSEKMALAQLFIQPEAAYFAISELGESGNVQFRDLNENVNTFQRKFVNEVRRCGEMERKLRYIETEVKKDKVSIPDVQELPKAPNPREIIDLEAHLEKTEGDIKELSESAINLKSNYLELTELKLVLEKTQTFFNGQNEANGLDSAYKALIAEDLSNLTIEGHLGFVAGVINRERVPGFERMLWRISRGNIFLRQVEIDEPLEDPATGHEIYKTVFVAFFQGDELQNRIKKICAGYHASLYVCPSSLPQRNEMLKGVSTRLEDLNLVLNQTQDHRQRVLVSVAKELQNWSIMVSKMKAIYHTLNFFNMDVTKKCLIGECWVPTKNIPAVQKALSDGAVSGRLGNFSILCLFL
jgi:V-type H+-transporting ATPase subunit a